MIRNVISVLSAMFELLLKVQTKNLDQSGPEPKPTIDLLFNRRLHMIIELALNFPI